jgi:hypothetical protein
MIVGLSKEQGDGMSSQLTKLCAAAENENRSWGYEAPAFRELQLPAAGSDPVRA